MADGLNMSRRIRRTPYTEHVEALGVRGFSVVNHMLLPKAFETSVDEDYCGGTATPLGTSKVQAGSVGQHDSRTTFAPSAL